MLMRKFSGILVTIVITTLFVSCTKKSADDEWVYLFDGKDISHWIVKINHHDAGDNFGETFRVEDEMIKVRYNQYDSFNNQFGHLYYEQPFSKFHLSLEYQFVGELQKGAPDYTMLNSGIMFHSQDPRNIKKDQDWPISVEMQLLAGLGDGKPRPTGNMCSPGTEIQFNGKQYDGHCLNSTSKTYPANEWVTAELVVWEDSLITHIINKDTVLQYSKPTMGGGVVHDYDSSEWEPGKALKSGFIALQSEGQPINFRNIKIRKLK